LKNLHAKRTRFPARRITVIHNGVDGRRFSPDASARAHFRRAYGVSDEEFCIGCVGNLIPVKDHLTLLRAVDGFARSGRPWRLLIAGAGPELPTLTAFADAHPAWKSRVMFLGRNNSIAGLLNAMDVFVLSSLTEGISNSLLEAMATGLPVVATATGGNPEVVPDDGGSGLLFPVGDAGRLTEHLLALDARPVWRKQLGQRALRLAREEFSIDSMVRKYEEIYQSFRAGVVAPMRVVART
jgi:glycosyltransferase involved in cell wall biosynthesis